MLHSQRLNSSLLCPWVIVENNGKVLLDHCTCMAGLAEVCKHVAALLFWVEMSVKMHTSKTVTELKAYWVTPSNNTSLQPQELINIDFRSPQLQRKCIETALITSPKNNLHEKNLSPKNKILTEKPSKTELRTFYSSLMESEKKPAIPKILPGFTDKFKPDAIQYEKKILTKLYSEDFVSLSFEDLLIKCNNIYEKITITQKDALNIESQIRNQAKSSKWYELRAGQITASVMKVAINTKIDSPSLPLIKKICY